VSRTPRVCVAIADHSADAYLDDLIAGLRRFFPEADVVWYDSGVTSRSLPGVARLPCSRVHHYAKVAAMFFDLFEWWADQDHDYLINLETDLAVVNPGVEVVANLMRDADYMAARLVTQVAATSRWRPYCSLRGELSELRDILGLDTVQGAFSPAQVFSRRYVGRILDSPFYPRLRDFVARNQAPDRSFTLQEVLLPTLAQVCGLRSRPYPAEHETYNRYRPYHALRSVRAARAANVPFVHPVRRIAEDAARQYVRALAVPAS
jgi:hypothetical protein